MRFNFFLFLFSLFPAFAAPSRAETPPAPETAIFAGGCFWCLHAEFEGRTGVQRVTSGYTGGLVENPTYEQVSRGNTGHVEAIRVDYDPAAVSYDALLEIFWDNVDPLDAEGQFCDKGSHYAAGIFYASPAQQAAAEQSLARVEKKLKTKVATFIRPAAPFYAAEEYHQGYHRKNPLRYELYKTGCGRADRLEEIWGENGDDGAR